jgi:hypothetical protein
MVSDNPVKASAAALALTASLLAGCATSAPGVVPSVATRLNATELVALSAKASRAEQRLYDGYEQGLVYALSANGELEVRSRFVTKQVVKGTWRVNQANGTFCTTLSPDPESCFALYWIGGNTYYADVPKLSQQANTLTLR